ncbi:SLAIN motif-containing protein 1a [Parambassis ranga]|uniref:SLAIN motif-containing protein 1a n=1 Tax=Parambassis ranga TaxID=210632 RepID=A0A6P7H766_9TELE|nr:SLAIN motif-containing protein 2-like [Parambassis ranga]
MEAEVLNPQMMADVNGNNKITNAELEVLKLQELVRKLEKQNEQLRTRANAVNNRSIGPAPLRTALSLSCLRGGADSFSCKYDISSPTQSRPCVPAPRGPAEEPFAYFQASSVSPGDDAAVEEEEEEEEEEDSSAAGDATVLDEVDVLDLNVVLPVGTPESWLYVSPRAKLQAESILSPLQWCRQVLDHPGPEVALARMTFRHRIDQAKRWRGVSPVRPYSCVEGLSTLSCPVLPYSKSAALTEPPASLPSSGQSPPLRASCSLSDRAPTFLSNSTLHNVGRQHAAITPQSSVDSDVGVSELEEDSISMSYKLQDMTDVEVMARLQEESLRQDYASTSATAAASRRNSIFSLHSLRRSEMDLEEEDEEEEEGYDQLPPPQPPLFRTGSMQRGSLPHSHTFSSIRDCRRSTATPQFSLSGLSQYSGPSSLITETQSAYRNSTDKLRRSMPNLIRAPSMPSVPSVPCLASPVNPPSHGPSSLPAMSSLRTSQSFDSSNGLARLQSSIPSPGQLSQRVQSVGNFPTTPRHPLKATAYVSPTVQQGPTATSLSTSTSLHSISSSTALPQPLKPSSSSSSLLPQVLKTNTNQSGVPRSSLPRPASFVGTSGLPRASKITQPTRSLLTPPKSLAALSALRDASWKDGCY